MPSVRFLIPFLCFLIWNASRSAGILILNPRRFDLESPPPWASQHKIPTPTLPPLVLATFNTTNPACFTDRLNRWPFSSSSLKGSDRYHRTKPVDKLLSDDLSNARAASCSARRVATPTRLVRRCFCFCQCEGIDVWWCSLLIAFLVRKLWVGQDPKIHRS